MPNDYQGQYDDQSQYAGEVDPTQPLPQDTSTPQYPSLFAAKRRDKKEMLRDLLGNFMYALGSGLTASSRAPIGSDFAAGLGASLTAANDLAEQRRKANLAERQQQELINLRRAQEAATYARAQAIPQTTASTVAVNQARTAELTSRPGSLHAKQILDALKGGWVPDPDQPSGYRRAAPDEMSAIQEANLGKVQAQTAATEATTKKARYMSSGGALFDVSGEKPTKVEGSDSKNRFSITKDIAGELGLPDITIGTSMTAQEINALLSGIGRTTVVASTSEGVFAYNKATDEKKRIGSPTAMIANVQGNKDTVDWLADQITLNPSNWKLTGNNRVLQTQVIQALAARGVDIKAITNQSRIMAEAAKTMMPKIEDLITKMDDPQWQAKLGPIYGRWNEFMTGTVGAGDPEFTKLRDTVKLIQSGVMRAHVGARGGERLLDYFTNMGNTKIMDPSTLKAALEAEKDFLGGYAGFLYAPTVKGVAVKEGAPDTKGKVWMIRVKDGKRGLVPVSQVPEALKSKEYTMATP